MNRVLPYSSRECNTLVDVLLHRADIHGNKVAYHFLTNTAENAQKITYSELDRQAKSIGAYLQQKYQPGERAILLYPPGLDLITAFFGCLYAGLVAVLANPPLNRHAMSKLELILKDAEPSCILTNERIHTKLLSLNILEGNPEHLLTNLLVTDKIELPSVETWQYPDIHIESLAFLQYTSGSTSCPKGVMVTHGNLLHNLDIIFRAFGLREDSINVSWLPPYHDMGLIGSILGSSYAGISSVLMPPLNFLQNPLSWLKTITAYKATISGGPNFAYNYCATKITDEEKKHLDLSSWELAYNGSEPIQNETFERFANAFACCGFKKKAFYPCYGLAEATLFVSGPTPEKGFQTISVHKDELQKNKIKLSPEKNANTQQLVSSGIFSQEIQIIDPLTNQLCTPDTIGEIWIHSPCVAAGYWQNPKATQEAFCNYFPNMPQKNYLRTGDLGFIHDDNLFITGRLKDLIIIHGKNYYPQDLEHSMSQIDMRIQENQYATFSLMINDEEQLGIICEVTTGLDANAHEEICQLIAKHIAKEHQLLPHTIALISPGTLPRTTSGKVRRFACREGINNGELAVLKLWINPVFQNND